MALEPNKKIIKGATREEAHFTFTYFDQCNRGVQDTFLAGDC